MIVCNPDVVNDSQKKNRRRKTGKNRTEGSISTHLILPHLNYCVTAWRYQCNRIINIQKKAIRTVMISSYNAHAESFKKILNY